MDVTYALTISDYKQAIKQFAKKHTSVQIKRLVSYSLPPIAAFVTILLGHGHSLTIAVLAALVTYLIWIPINIFIKRARIRAIFNQRNFHLSRVVTLTEDGVQVMTPLSSSVISWRGIRRIYDDPQFIHFMLEKNSFIFIPKRAFSTSAESANFLFTAQSYWYARSHVS